MANEDATVRVSEQPGPVGHGAVEMPDVSERPPLEPQVDPSPKPWRLTPVNFLLWAGSLSTLVLAGLVLGGALPSSTGFYVFALASMSLSLQWTLYSKRPVPVTIRKAVRRLPVLRDPGAQRIGALLGVAGTTCGRCEHFDLVAGQKMLVGTTFGMAAQILEPSQMLKTKSGAWARENGFDEHGMPLNDGKTRWNELGGCSLKKIGVFAPHSCKDWS